MINYLAIWGYPHLRKPPCIIHHSSIVSSYINGSPNAKLHTTEAKGVMPRGTHGLHRMQQKREVWASWWVIYVIYIYPAVLWALLTEKIKRQKSLKILSSSAPDAGCDPSP